jgi:hypothetical protein
MKRVIILLSLFSVIFIGLFSCSDNINQPVSSLEKSNLCIAEPGFNPNAVLKAGIRYKSFNSGNDREVYLGNGLLSPGSRTEIDFYNGLTCDSNVVYGNWIDTNFVSFSYDPAIGKIFARVDCNYSFCTEYNSGNMGVLNYIQISIANRASGTSVKFKNVRLIANGNIYNVGNFTSTNWNDWMVNNIDLSNGFTIEGKIILCGAQPDGELNKVQIVVGDTTQNSTGFIVQPGWNLISIPRLSPSMHIDTLLIARNSSVYRFDHINRSYTRVEQLENGSGYFVGFENEDTISILGTTLTSPIEVKSGWNMIGLYEKEIVLSQISTNPPNNITSAFFRFDAVNKVYATSDTLRIGSGYWVQFESDGQLIFNSLDHTNESIKKFYPKDDWDKIMFKDNKGRMTKLYFGEDIEHKHFMLPPIFPNNDFDIRFEDESYVTELNKDISILIKCDSFPIKVSTTGNSLYIYSEGSETLKTVTQNESIRIDKNTSKIIVKALDNKF